MTSASPGDLSSRLPPHAPTRRLGLLRHAHANNTAPSGRDFDRALSPQGQADAAKVGAWLAHNNVRFDRIVASPAVRTWQTAQPAAAALGLAAEALIPEPRVYEAHESDLLQVLAEHAGDVLLVGHNPAISELAQHLSDDQDIRARGMVKGALVLLELAAELQDERVAGELRRESVRSYRMVRPAEL